MDLCFISSPEQKPPSSGQCVWVCPDYACREQLKGEGKEAVMYDEYLNAEEGKKGDKFAFDLSVQWHFHNGEDFTKYKGASLGRAYEWTIWHETFIPRIKYLVSVHELLKHEKPKKIMFDLSLGIWRLGVLRAVALKNEPKIDIEVYGQPRGQEDDVFKNTPTEGYAQKNRRNEELKKLFAAFMNTLWHEKVRSPSVLTQPYFAFRTLYSQLKKTRDAHFHFVFFSVSNVLIQLNMLNDVTYYQNHPESLGAESKKKIEQILADWKIIRNTTEYRRKFAYLGVELFGIFEQEIDRFMKRVLLDYAKEFEDNVRSLKMEKIDALLLPFTVPPKSSLLLQAAKLQGTPIALLRHGITYLHDHNTRDDVDADIIFCWGQMQKEHYKAMQKDAGFKLIETGNPKFDLIYEKRQKAPIQKKERPAILYLTTGKENAILHFKEGSAERALLTFLDVMTGQGLDIVIKLHPAASKEYFDRLIGNRMKGTDMKVSVKTGTDPQEFIDNADVVVGTYSTTLLEAALSGKPTIFYNYNPLNEDKAYAKLDQYGISEYTPETAGQMKKRIIELLGLIQKGKSPAPFKTGGQEYLCGPFDGKSSERVLYELQKIVKERKTGAQ